MATWLARGFHELLGLGHRAWKSQVQQLADRDLAGRLSNWDPPSWSRSGALIGCVVELDGTIHPNSVKVACEGSACVLAPLTRRWALGGTIPYLGKTSPALVCAAAPPHLLFFPSHHLAGVTVQGLRPSFFLSLLRPR
jgi:hypothetical protein